MAATRVVDWKVGIRVVSRVVAGGVEAIPEVVKSAGAMAGGVASMVGNWAKDETVADAADAKVVEVTEEGMKVARVVSVVEEDMVALKAATMAVGEVGEKVVATVARKAEEATALAGSE